MASTIPPAHPASRRRGRFVATIAAAALLTAACTWLGSFNSSPLPESGPDAAADTARDEAGSDLAEEPAAPDGEDDAGEPADEEAVDEEAQGDAPGDLDAVEETSPCTGHEQCDDGHDCTLDICNLSGECEHFTQGTTTVCRPSADLCDAPDVCNGSSLDCPADLLRPSAHECRPSAGQCDVAESCDGTGAACPSDLKRAGGDPCDDGLACTAPDECDGGGRCAGAETGRLHAVAGVAAGAAHTCALLSDGRALCWGSNGAGRLGNGTTTNSLTPVPVASLGGPVRALSSGIAHSCAVLSSGSVRCWGENGRGQLGDNSLIDKALPVAPLGLTLPAVDVACGGEHTCVLLSSGGVVCWGANARGQLGNGSVEDKRTPVTVAGVAGVTKLAAGGEHTCAITGGRLKCWGANTSGQLGDGTYEDCRTPLEVSGLAPGIRLVAAGGLHTCAVQSATSLLCWGDNEHGQLGNGTTIASNVPVMISYGAQYWVDLAAGAWHGCALGSTGILLCVGDNQHGQIGAGAVGMSSTPVVVTGLPAGLADISAGESHTCAAGGSGQQAFCWGSNGYGRLGDGTTASSPTPMEVACAGL